MAGRELHRFEAPLPARQRMALGRFPSSFHRLINAVAEDGAIGFGAVVVLAGGDIAGAAREVHLEDVAIFLLAFLPRQPAKITADSPVAVITHRMSRVITQCCLRLIAMAATQC